MKNFFYSLFLCILVVACNTPNAHIERINLTPRIIADSLCSMLPGKILLCAPYLVWQDGFATDTFMHLIDLRSGAEVGKMGKTGRGAEEFVSPNLIGNVNRHIVIFDDDLPKCAFYSIDSLLLGRNPYTPLKNSPLKQVCDAAVIDSSTFVALQFAEQLPFRVVKDGRVISSFGKYPIRDSISNRYGTCQGSIAYHPEKKLLLYSASRFPYFALYRKNAGYLFAIVKESDYPIFYKVKEKEAQIADENAPAFRNPTFLRDYIVFRKQDEDNPLPEQKPTPGIRDLSSVPHTIYIFDYDLNLLKIADLNMPVLTITGNPHSNTLYFWGLKDSFCIAKCEIE